MQNKHWKGFKLFFMKWRFRLDQARSLFGLITFAALLANDYISYLIFLDEPKVWHLAIFTLLVFIVFVIGGYLYDKVLRLWSEAQTITIQRNPYSWVPSPKEEILWLGWMSYLFNSMSQIASKLDVELEGEEMIKEHMQQFFKLRPTTEDFEQEALKIKKISFALEKKFLKIDEASISKNSINENSTNK